MNRKPIHALLACAGVVWLGGLALGVVYLNRYQSTPGAQVAIPERWPTSAPQLNSSGHTLALFLHPECPCSNATLASLDQIMTRSDGSAKAYVFAVLPPGAPADWQESSLIARAHQIKGVEVVIDREGALARQFSALTSGQVALYNAAGDRVFAGGITQSRGHEGPSAGSIGILNLLQGHSPSIATTPVYGCSLFGTCTPPPASRGTSME